MSVKLTPSDGQIQYRSTPTRHGIPAAACGTLWTMGSAALSPSFCVRTLGHPVLAGASGLAGLILSLAAVLGVAARPLFWGAIAALALMLALTSTLVRNARLSQRCAKGENAVEVLRQKATGHELRLAKAEAAAVHAREDWEACEAGYARLRAVIIGGYQTDEDRDYFDGELQHALDRHNERLRDR